MCTPPCSCAILQQENHFKSSCLLLQKHSSAKMGSTLKPKNWLLLEQILWFSSRPTGATSLGLRFDPLRRKSKMKTSETFSWQCANLS